jgi:hypothetical protein
MVEAVFAVLVVGEDEVQDADHVDILQVEVPVAAGCLFTDGVSGVENAAVFEIVLLGLLHFDDELLAIGVLAIDIEDGLAVCKACTKVLVVEILDVDDFLVTVEQGIEETDEQVFVHLCTEELLEAEVGIWVDVALFAGVNHILLMGICCCKDTVKLANFQIIAEFSWVG